MLPILHTQYNAWAAEHFICLCTKQDICLWLLLLVEPPQCVCIMHMAFMKLQGNNSAVCMCASLLQVKRQADHQELLEQQCSDTDRLSRWEAERAALATQHGREQQAADKKMSSALLEAQLSQQQEMEQLTRRFQVGIWPGSTLCVCV